MAGKKKAIKGSAEIASQDSSPPRKSPERVVVHEKGVSKVTRPPLPL